MLNFNAIGQANAAFAQPRGASGGQNFLAGAMAGQRIRGAQNRNRMGKLALEDAERQAANLKRRDAIMKDIQETPARIAALQNAGLYREAEQVADSSIGVLQGELGFVKNVLSQADSPAKWEATRQALVESGVIRPEEMDTRFSPGAVKKMQDERRSMIARIQKVRRLDKKTGQVMERDVGLNERGEVVRRFGGEVPDSISRQMSGARDLAAAKASSGSRARELKAADSNVITKDVSRLFDVTTYTDANGVEQIGFIKNAEDRRIAANLKSKTERHWLNAGGRMTYGEALIRAVMDLPKSEQDRLLGEDGIRKILGVAGVPDQGPPAPERPMSIEPPGSPMTAPNMNQLLEVIQQNRRPFPPMPGAF